MTDALERLYHSGLRFLLPLTPDETYAMLVAEATKLIGAKYGSILISHGNKLVREYSTLSVPVDIKPRDKGYTSHVFETGQPLVLQAKEIYKIHPELLPLKINQTVFIPLTYYNQTLGVMILALTSKRKITKQHLQLLKIFGAIATLSIRKTQLYQDMKKALATRDTFLSMISHELKTPATAINIYLQLLQKNADKLDVPFINWIKELTQELADFTRIFNELLNVEKLTTDLNLADMQVVNLQEVVSGVLHETQKLYPKSHISFVSQRDDSSCFVEGNKQKLSQAVAHILHNAVKFSSSKSMITVQLTFDSPHYKLSIQDQGKGIAKKYVKKIANKFYKPKTNYKDGLGLGLFISKTIIAQHNGSIRISSKSNKGTKVTIALPALHIS